MDIALGSAVVALPAVDVEGLSQAARIEALTEVQRARAWADATEQRLLAALVAPGEVPVQRRVSAAVAAKQYVREEIACALQVSPVTVNDRLHTARLLCGPLSATLVALGRGELTMRHARILIEAVTPLDDRARGEVESVVLEVARTQTPTRFTRSVARAVLGVDPRGGEQRHEEALAQRRVATRTEPDGMGSLLATGSAQDLQAVRAVLDDAADAHPEHDGHCARTLDAQGRVLAADPDCAGCASRARTSDQRRADAFVALLLGLDVAQVQTRHGRRPVVQVSVALSTLLELDEQPGDLDGYGPIPAPVARRIAGDPSGTWRRLVTDPLGHLLDYGRSTYRPPQDLTDHVIARDRTCRFPGCGRRAVTCELDHLLDWDHGGHTNEHNLLACCPRHHHLRHDAGWHVEGDPDSILTWTTPTGYTYDADTGRHPIDTTTATDWLDPPPRAPAAHDPPPF